MDRYIIKAAVPNPLKYSGYDVTEFGGGRSTRKREQAIEAARSFLDRTAPGVRGRKINAFDIEQGERIYTETLR